MKPGAPFISRSSTLCSSYLAIFVIIHKSFTGPETDVMRHFSHGKPSVFISQKIFPGGDGASSGRAAMTSPGRETGSGPGVWRGRCPPGCGWSPPTTAWRRTVWSGVSARPGRGGLAQPAVIISATSANCDPSPPDLSQIILFSSRVPYLISYRPINIC